jgi:hypothetical protein
MKTTKLTYTKLTGVMLRRKYKPFWTKRTMKTLAWIVLSRMAWTAAARKETRAQIPMTAKSVLCHLRHQQIQKPRLQQEVHWPSVGALLLHELAIQS